MDKQCQGFRFKQFTVQHKNSIMKVGTDAVLLGAWATLNSKLLTPNFLDIGCGCGIISLMLAQRFPEAHVTGIDIDEPSVQEAQENALASPFADRLTFSVADVRMMTGTSGQYDLIVSNPPFYLADTMPPDERRAMARNAHNLSPAELIQSARRMLSDHGTLALVLPTEARDVYVDAAHDRDLYLTRQCLVRTTPRKQAKRILLEFSPHTSVNIFQQETLSLLKPDGTRSEQYQKLCQEFYL